MHRLRILLLIPAMAIEFALLVACGVCAALRFMRAAQSIHDWATRKLPSIDWYIRT